MASTRKVLKKILKGIVAVLLIAFTILFTIQVIIIVHFDKLIENTLKETVLASTNELYSVDFKNLSINVFTGSVTARQVILKPDSVIYERLKEMKMAPSLLFNIYIPDLKISRVNLYSAYFDKYLDIHSIKIKDPIVNLLNEPLNRQESESSKNPLDLYSLISPIFDRAGAKKIEITNGRISYKRVKRKEIFSQKISVNSLVFSEILIDSTAYLDKRNFLYSDDINLVLDNYSAKLPDSMYTAKCERITLSTKNSEILINNITLVPRYGKYQFAKVKGTQTDRIFAKIKEVKLNKIDFRKALENQMLKINEVVFSEATLDIFRDKQIPNKVKEKKELPQETFKRLRFPVDIEKVRLKNLNINYEEVSENGGEPGKVKFTSIYARITDINNHPTAIRKGQTIWVRAEGHLMGKGLIKAKFRFPLNNTDSKFYYSGTLFEIDFEELNPAIKPLALIEIKSGKIKKIEFDVVANDESSSGSMKLHYSNLKIQLLNQDKNEVGFKEKIGSFLANSFIVESDNPKNGELRVGAMFYKRDQTKSIFNFWWKTLLSGIKPSIGITEERQSSLEQFKKKFEIRKKKREEKKKEKEERKTR